MVRLFLSAGLLFLLVVRPAPAADPVLVTAQGTLDKVGKESIAVRPRGDDGRFGKSVVLRLTGTSKITTLTPQTRAGRLVITQRDTDAKDLQPKQFVAVIYATGAGEPVLLA